MWREFEGDIADLAGTILGVALAALLLGALAHCNERHEHPPKPTPAPTQIHRVDSLAIL